MTKGIYSGNTVIVVFRRERPAPTQAARQLPPWRGFFPFQGRNRVPTPIAWSLAALTRLPPCKWLGRPGPPLRPVPSLQEALSPCSKNVESPTCEERYALKCLKAAPS